MNEKDEQHELSSVDELLDDIAAEEELYDRLWRESAEQSE